MQSAVLDLLQKSVNALRREIPGAKRTFAQRPEGKPTCVDLRLKKILLQEVYCCVLLVHLVNIIYLTKVMK
jgi:hypothetical protein